MNRKELQEKSSPELDELVHAAKLEEGSRINNEGKNAQINYLLGESSTDAMADSCNLARLVYQAVYDATETFEDDNNIGPDLCYLLGAIVKNSTVEWYWESLPALYTILSEVFKDKCHPVWDHIAIWHPEKKVT